MDGEALDKEIELEEVNKLFALAALIISKSRFCFSLSTLPIRALRRKNKNKSLINWKIKIVIIFDDNI